MSLVFIYILYIIAIAFGIFVIISKNPVVSVLFLIGLFLSISCYLILAGLNFIGLSYLLVYIGAVSILFLFILMLINVRISELTSETNNSIPLAIIIGVFFNITLYKLLPSNITSSNLFNIQSKLFTMETTEGGVINLNNSIINNKKKFLIYLNKNILLKTVYYISLYIFFCLYNIILINI